MTKQEWVDGLPIDAVRTVVNAWLDAYEHARENGLDDADANRDGFVWFKRALASLIPPPFVVKAAATQAVVSRHKTREAAKAAALDLIEATHLIYVVEEDS